MSQNADAVANQGEFAGHVRPSEPLMTGGVSQYMPEPLISTGERFCSMFARMFS